MKRILYLAGVVAVVAAIVAAGYFLRYRGGPAGEDSGETASDVLISFPEPQAPGGVGIEAPTKLEFNPAQKLNRLAAGGVAAFFPYSATSTAILRSNGEIILLTPSGATALSAALVENILSASFSRDGKRLAVIFGDRKSPQASVFNLENKSWQPLSQTVFALAWSPKDLRLAYFAKSTAGAMDINVLDASRTPFRPQRLMSLNVADPTISWPKSDQIVVGEKSSAAVLSSVFEVSPSKKTTLPFLTDINGLIASWSGFSEQGLVFESGERGGFLWLADKGGSVSERLSFLTLPDKCTFGMVSEREQLFCAVPTNSQAFKNGVLPDAYYKRDLLTNDWFYRIDVKTGEVFAVYEESGAALDAQDPILVGDILYFLNRLDGGLYAVSL